MSSAEHDDIIFFSQRDGLYASLVCLNCPAVVTRACVSGHCAQLSLLALLPCTAQRHCHTSMSRSDVTLVFQGLSSSRCAGASLGAAAAAGATSCSVGTYATRTCRNGVCDSQANGISNTEGGDVLCANAPAGRPTPRLQPACSPAGGAYGRARLGPWRPPGRTMPASAASSRCQGSARQP
jgi:hypothetical protein